MIGEQARQSMTFARRRHGSFDGVYDETRSERYRTRHGGTFERRKTPRMETKVRHRNELMLRQVGRLGNARMRRKIPGRCGDHPADLTQSDRYVPRIRQVSN